MATFGGETLVNQGSRNWVNATDTYTVPAGRYAKIVINRTVNFNAGVGTAAFFNIAGGILIGSDTSSSVYSHYIGRELVINSGETVSMSSGSSGNTITVHFSFREFNNA